MLDPIGDATRRGLYDALVSEHAADLHALAFRLTGLRDVAEDLVQEAFAGAWQSLDTLSDRSRARSWLMQILRHRWLHWRRARAARPAEAGGLDLVEARHVPPEPPAGNEVSQDLQVALDELDERFREPFLMVFLQGMTCREVAEELAIPLGTVLSRIHRARLALRDLVSRQATVPALRVVRRDGERA